MKKGEFKFTSYLVFMFIAITLVGVLGGISSSLLLNYDVNTSDSFNNYMNSFDDSAYANQDKLEIAKSDSDSEFSLYESSFQFGDQVKTTQNQTRIFVTETTKILGLPDQVWYIIISILVIMLLVAIAFFIRGINE